MAGVNPPGVLLATYRVYGMPSYSTAWRMDPSTGSVPSAEMTRSFASTVAEVTGSSVEPDVAGAFEGKTWGSEGIVGSSGGPRGKPGGGAGKGNGRGGGGGGGGAGTGNGNGGGVGN